jgi:hypothetical protein
MTAYHKCTSGFAGRCVPIKADRPANTGIGPEHASTAAFPSQELARFDGDSVSALWRLL